MKKILCILIVMIVVYIACIALSIHEVKVPVCKNINDSLYRVVKIDTETINQPFEVKHIWYTKR